MWLLVTEDPKRFRADSIDSSVIRWVAIGHGCLDWIAVLAGSLLAAVQSDDDAAQILAIDKVDVRSALGGCDEAFRRIVSRYQNEIASQMWSFVKSRERCEELVHDVFVEAYMSLHGFRGKAPLLHWLRRIATRVGYRYWKRERSQTKEQSGLWSIADWHECVGALDGQQSSMEAAEQVRTLLAQMAPRDRLVLTFIYLEGRSIEETADLCGWSRTMVRVQAHRARAKLKKLLES